MNSEKRSLSDRGSMQIKDPELLWPIVLLAAVSTAVIGLLLVVMQYVAMSHPPESSYTAPTNTWKTWGGEFEFGEVKQK